MLNFILILVLQTQPQSPVVHFFYAPDCGHCMDIILGDIPALQKKYQFQFKKYDINILENYELLEKMEEHVENKGEDLPIVFVGDSVFYGPDSFRRKFESTIKILVKESGTFLEDTVEEVIGNIVPGISQIYLYYFYQTNCRVCTRVEFLLNGLEKNYKHLTIFKFDILIDSNKIFYETLAEKMNAPEAKSLVVPAIFIGADYLIKDEITFKKLNSLLIKYRDGSQKLYKSNVDLGTERIIKRFSRFSVFGIMVAGFLDGINPCAFATLIFFVSYLLFIGRRRRDIIMMSIFFITAVFVAYLIIGLGAYSIIKFLSKFEFLGKIIFFGFGVFAIILGILSLRDYVMAQKGAFNKMILQLPFAIKQRIQKDIIEKTAMGGIIFGSLVAGFLISLLEFGCTGQVYLPTITFMTSKMGFRLKPLLALVIYNIMFILPLIVIALLATLFINKNITRLLVAKIPLIKMLTALLFFVLGILLILLA